MATAKKRPLSADSNGMGIQVAATTTVGTTIHTATSSTTAGTYDEIWLWAMNRNTSDVQLTIEYGDATTSNNIVVTIPFKSGLIPVLPGTILQNSKTVKAFANITNVITLFGFVNTITD